MSAGLPLDGRPYVADTSAWAQRRSAGDEWSRTLQAGQIWITPVVKLELLYSTRDRADFAALEERLDRLREAHLDRTVVRAAVAALRELAAQGPLHHRVPITDALIAAAAAERGVGVLHYDEHFDRLATVLAFESRWIVVRGSA